MRLPPDGDLWVEQYTLPDTRGRIDVCSPSGEYRGTLVGIGTPVGFLRGGVVIGVEMTNDTGGYALYRYRLAPAAW